MTTIDRNKLRVLIVDDEVDFASTIVTRLKLRNYDAAMANSGKEALAAIAETCPDVLLLDLKMPDLDGLEVLAGLKENHPELAVIILTGHGSVEAGRQGKELGAFDYIMKPVELQLLMNTIEEAYQSKTEKNS